MKISISFFKNLLSKKETIAKINKLSDDGYLHVDFTDGIYTNSEKLNIKEYQDLLKESKRKLDVHLMCLKPSDYLQEFCYLKPEFIAIHLDIEDDIFEIYEVLKNNNIKLGLVLNPDDDIKRLEEYKEIIDEVLVMSVIPGAGGQSFIPDTVSKLIKLNEFRKNNNLNFKINVDGGINDETIKLVKDYVNIAVCGSFITCQENFEEQLAKLKEAIL